MWLNEKCWNGTTGWSIWFTLPAANGKPHLMVFETHNAELTTFLKLLHFDVVSEAWFISQALNLLLNPNWTDRKSPTRNIWWIMWQIADSRIFLVLEAFKRMKAYMLSKCLVEQSKTLQLEIENWDCLIGIVNIKWSKYFCKLRQSTKGYGCSYFVTLIFY